MYNKLAITQYNPLKINILGKIKCFASSGQRPGIYIQRLFKITGEETGTKNSE